MYDRPPKAGGLLEAVFLIIWLRKEEQKVKAQAMFAAGIQEMTNAMGGKSSMSERFQDYVKAVAPYEKTLKGPDEKDMVKMMQKEVLRGPLKFSTDERHILKSAVKKVSVTDDFREKLENRVKRGPR